MKIILDCREHKLIEIFPDSIVRQLDCGDIQIVNDDNEICCIIERKTLADLHSSIIDGRYREQKHRLLSNFSKVYYIIEGFQHYNIDTLLSAMMNCVLRDNISLFRSKDIQETASIIKLLEKKIRTGTIVSEYSVLSTTKRKNVSVKDVYLAQLTCIPGISTTIAKNIASTFPSLLDLITNIENVKEVSKVGPKLQSSIKTNLQIEE